MGWVLLGDRVGHESKVVVAMRSLCLSARIDEIDLGRDLVPGTEPGRGDDADGLAGVVVHERCGVGEGQLLHRVPDTVVGARGGEVIAADRVAGSLLGDHRLEHRSGTIDDVGTHGAGDHDDARTVQQPGGQLGSYGT